MVVLIWEDVETLKKGYLVFMEYEKRAKGKSKSSLTQDEWQSRAELPRHN